MLLLVGSSYLRYLLFTSENYVSLKSSKSNSALTFETINIDVSDQKIRICSCQPVMCTYAGVLNDSALFGDLVQVSCL